MFKINIILYLLVFLQSNTAPVISWNESYQLTWSDFKAKALKGNNAAAITASGISFSFSVRERNKHVINFATKVHAHFYPEESWYKPKHANTFILAHEQLHFDITELFARKFRQRISVLEPNNTVSTQLKNVHKSIKKELASFQKQYDGETDFSRDEKAQLKWQTYINKELKKLDKFKSKS